MTMRPNRKDNLIPDELQDAVKKKKPKPKPQPKPVESAQPPPTPPPAPPPEPEPQPEPVAPVTPQGEPTKTVASSFVPDSGKPPPAPPPPAPPPESVSTLDDTGDVPGSIPAGPSYRLPSDLRIVIVDTAEGDFGGREYWAYSDPWGKGVRLAFRIGTPDEYEALFQGKLNLSTEVVSQGQFRDAFISVGTIDELLIAPGEPGRRYVDVLRQQLALSGVQNIPAWVGDDLQALTVLLTGAAEGWDEGKMWANLKAHASTAFYRRFASWDGFAETVGTSDVLALRDEYLRREQQVMTLLRKYRGRIDRNEVAQIVGSGWTAEEAEPLLRVEAQINNNPGLLDDVNAIMGYAGLPTMTPDDLATMMVGQSSPQIYTAINDAYRRRALLDAGIDLPDAVVAALGPDAETRVLSPEEQQNLSRYAQDAALEMIRNERELAFGVLGLNRERLVQAAFGEADAETQRVLARVRADREAQAGGWENFTSYQDARGALRVMGLGRL